MIHFYVSDKAIPQTKAEFESYSKLGKFQRHEKYPNIFVRKFIENTLLLDLSNEQYQDYIVNHFEFMRQLKDEVGDAISTLYKARSKIYRSIMLQDLLKTQFITKTIKKKQFENLAHNVKMNNIKISYDEIFDIKREDIQVERKVTIPNPKLFAKAAINGVKKSESGDWPKHVSELYHATEYSCRAISPTNS